MNTPVEQGKKPSLSSLASDYDDHSKAIKALAEAQEEIGQLREARKEERVGWIVISVILFDWTSSETGIPVSEASSSKNGSVQTQ